MKTKIMILLTLLLVGSLFSIENLEKLTFNIRYGFISAAEAELFTQYIIHTDSIYTEPIEALKVTSKAKTYAFFDVFFKVRDMIVSISEQDSGLAIFYEKNLREGSYEQRRIHYYDRENENCIYQKWKFNSEEFSTSNIAIPKDTYDFLGAFYSIRQQDFVVGDTIRMTMSGDGITFDANIVVLEREKLKTIFGKKQCLKIEPQLAGETIFKNTGKIYIWLTDDEYKIPVKMESEVKYGSFVADLKDAENVGLKVK
jgi:hypothetical protein